MIAERVEAGLPVPEVRVADLAEHLASIARVLEANMSSVRIYGGYARAWAESAVADTASGVRVPSPGLREHMLTGHPDRLPPPQAAQALDDAIQEQIDRVKAAERESWRKLFADFPRGSSHGPLKKARWLARKYAEEGHLPQQYNFLRGIWFNHACAHHFRTTEVSVELIDEQTRGRKQLFRVDGIRDDEVVSLTLESRRSRGRFPSVSASTLPRGACASRNSSPIRTREVRYDSLGVLHHQLERHHEASLG
ncbi:hypothetical protein [Myceligenerans halotolerans]